MSMNGFSHFLIFHTDVLATCDSPAFERLAIENSPVSSINVESHPALKRGQDAILHLAAFEKLTPLLEQLVIFMSHGGKAFVKPLQFFGLRNLQTIHLGFCSLIGHPGSGTIVWPPAVENITLDRCSLQGVHTITAGSACQLSMSDCDGMCPSLEFDCPRLEVLELQGSLELRYPNLQGCCNLFKLQVSGSPLWTLIAPATVVYLEARSCIDLKSVEFCNRSICKSVDLQGCSKIKELDLDGCRHMQKLDVSNCVSLLSLSLKECDGLVSEPAGDATEWDPMMGMPAATRLFASNCPMLMMVEGAESIVRKVFADNS